MQNKHFVVYDTKSQSISILHTDGTLLIIIIIISVSYSMTPLQIVAESFSGSILRKNIPVFPSPFYCCLLYMGQGWRCSVCVPFLKTVIQPPDLNFHTIATSLWFWQSGIFLFIVSKKQSSFHLPFQSVTIIQFYVLPLKSDGTVL